MHPDLRLATAQAHIHDLERAARAVRMAADATPARGTLPRRLRLRRSRVNATHVTPLAAGGSYN